MAIFNRTISNATSPNIFGRSSMPMMYHIGEFQLRAGSRYLDIKTNLATQSDMLFFYFWGYLYNSANCFGYAGCYPYNGSSILNKYIYNTGTTGLADIYKTGSPFYLCFKFDRQSDGYTEGNINVFIARHSLDIAVGVLEYAQNNSASAYYT